MSRLKLIALMALAGILPSCESAPLTAPNNSTMFLQANPVFVIANGGVSVVTAVLVEPAGTFVPDGTEVFFFTNLGRIDPSGKTVNGIARVNFVADARSGQATVTAISGSVQVTLEPTISVGSANPTQVQIAADPPRISAGRTVSVVATVFDASGNPVQNVPVAFSITAGGSSASLESGSAFLYTNSNGQVTDTLRAVAVPVASSVTVTATTANNQVGSVTVPVI